MIPIEITVTGTVTDSQDVPVAGAVVTFSSSTLIRAGSGGAVMIPTARSATTDALGAFSLDVPSTDDPAWAPVGWSWLLSIRDGQGFRVGPYAVSIPHDAPGGTVTLAELVPSPSVADAELYATLAALNNLADDVAEKVDSGDLPEYLNVYLTDYLAAYMASYMTAYLTTAGAAATYLNRLTGGTVLGNVTLADAASPTKAYRLKSSGGGLDFDAAGAGLFISAYPNANFTGTQRAYMRLESGVQLAHLIGRYIGAADPDTTVAVIDWDPSTGLVKLGSKNNGLANISSVRVAARSKTTGWPTVGTWALDDLVLCNDGWYECTTAGTPGAGTKRG